MTFQFLAFFFICVSVAYSVDLEHGDECYPADTINRCNPNKFLECTREYDVTALNGTCQCRADTHYDLREDTCELDVGASCAATGPKCPLRSTCSNTPPRCVCSEGFVEALRRPKICLGDVNTQCYIPLNYEDAELVESSSEPSTESTTEPTTESTTEATTPYPFLDVVCNQETGLACRSNGTSDSCQCSAQSVYSTYRRKCVYRADESCPTSRDDDVCVENAKCEASRCNCLSGFSRNPGNGHCEAAYKSQCFSTTSKTECNSAENLECLNDLCECRSGTSIREGIGGCKLLAKESCENNADCWSGFCHPTAKVCLCRATLTVELNDGTCGNLGVSRNDYCTDETQCNRLGFLECNFTMTGSTKYGKCECVRGMTYEDGRCRVHAGSDCSVNQNCVRNAVCNHLIDGGTCECEANHFETPDHYCHGSHLETCTTTPCKDGLGLECPRGICECPAGQEWRGSLNNDKDFHCVALVAGNCTTQSEYCTKNTHCTKAGTCECDEGYSYYQRSGSDDARRCLREYGQECNSTGDYRCNPRHDFLVCSAAVNGVCQCEYGQQQIYNSVLGICQSVAGGHCGILEENYGLNMTCAPNSECRDDENGISKCVCTVFPAEDGQVCLSEVPTTEGTTTPSQASHLFPATVLVFLAVISKLLFP